MKYNRILLKLSGEALSGKKGNVYDNRYLDSVCKTIKKVHDMGVDVGIVIGGGNIWRGKNSVDGKIDAAQADYMGIIATIINAICLKERFLHNGIPATMISALAVENVTPKYSKHALRKALRKHQVIIFGGGTGHPFCTTDTCAANRAVEMKADAVLMAKNGVDGVYSEDPRKGKNKKAKLLKELTFKKVINKKLAFMDLGAAKILKDAGIEAVVFNGNNLNNIVRILKGEEIGTHIKKEA